MKVLTKESVLNDWRYWNKALLICSIKGECSKTEIMKKIGYKNETNGYFNAIIKFLEINDFLDVDKTRIPYTIKVRNKELLNFLGDGGNVTDIFDLFVRMRGSFFIY